MEVLSVRDEGRNPVNEGRGATRARKEGKEVIKRGGKGEREDWKGRGRVQKRFSWFSLPGTFLRRRRFAGRATRGVLLHYLDRWLEDVEILSPAEVMLIMDNAILSFLLILEYSSRYSGTKWIIVRQFHNIREGKSIIIVAKLLLWGCFKYSQSKDTIKRMILDIRKTKQHQQQQNTGLVLAEWRR